MPNVLRTGPLPFLLLLLDRHDPPHVHVERQEMNAKFWLDPSASRRVVVSEDQNFIDWAEVEEHKDLFSGNGMNTSQTELRSARAESVQITEDSLVWICRCRTVSVTIAWYPRLAHGTNAERSNWRLMDEVMASTGPTSTKTLILKACWRSPFRRIPVFSSAVLQSREMPG